MAGQNAFEQCRDLWLDDGNVILKAEGMAFRVYSGILSRHSPFFKGLLTLPQPPQAETYEGCPVVTLEGDSAEELRYFLLFLFDAEQAMSYLKNPDAVIAILKLSHKYDASSIHRHVATSLVSIIPTTLEAFDSPETTEAFKRLFTRIEHLILLACVAERAAPILLPSVLHKIAQHNLFTVTNIIQDHRDSQHLNSPRDVPLFKLTPTLERALLIGRMHLNQRAREDVYPSLFYSWRAGPCSSATACNAIRNEIREFVEGGEDGWADPFNWGFLNECSPNGLCPSCDQQITQDYSTGRVKVWDKHPELFGLPSWEELRRLTFDS